jgi:hypothetical protein
MFIGTQSRIDVNLNIPVSQVPGHDEAAKESKLYLINDLVCHVCACQLLLTFLK